MEINPLQKNEIIENKEIELSENNNNNNKFFEVFDNEIPKFIDESRLSIFRITESNESLLSNVLTEEHKFSNVSLLENLKEYPRVSQNHLNIIFPIKIYYFIYFFIYLGNFFFKFNNFSKTNFYKFNL
jgi:hypothetical protein